MIIIYKHISSVVSEILFLINILLIFNVFDNINIIDDKANASEKSQEKKIKGLNFNLLIISWFFIYLIFFSFSDVKVDRYFITILPVIAYFVAYSLEYIIQIIVSSNKFISRNKFTSKNKFFINKNNTLTKRKNNCLMVNISTVVTVGLILIFIGSSFVDIRTIPIKNKNIGGPSEISEWLIKYDPNYNTKVIWTHNIRYYT